MTNDESLRAEIENILWYPESESFMKKNFPLTHDTIKISIDKKTDKILKLIEKRIDEMIRDAAKETVSTSKIYYLDNSETFKTLLKVKEMLK